MLAALAHRGPDDEGLWGEGGVWLGQRRLAIIDTSPGGHQPMVSACGRWVLVANGEIYNFQTLRAEVEADGPVAWRGGSDSEVLLEAIARLGVDEALARARGMFAVAVWDRLQRVAYLARDRFGEKPLYYHAQAGALTFASELTALERVADIEQVLDAQALSLFFRYGYVPAPLSIYRSGRKLPPGCILTWREGAAAVVTPYFSLTSLADAGQCQPLSDPEAAVESLDRLLRDAVGEQMVSDVPLGAFLSGGIDSSLIVGIMQSLTDRPVKTFTLGFKSPEFNEAEHAAAVARHLGTDHTEHYVTSADAQAIAQRLGDIYDEPFADASQIPTFLISEMARRAVTVCLTGDAGDEMFGGYVRYAGVPRMWKALGGWPLRGAAGAVLGAVPLRALERGASALGPLAREYAARGRLGPSLRRAAAWLPAKSLKDLYERTMTAWPDPDLLIGRNGGEGGDWRPAPPAPGGPLAWMQWRDSVDYLPGDILCKVDRAAMAHGLETRVPLLDPRVAAFAWRAPDSMKIRGGEAKWLLRRVLDRYVPRHLIDRPKLGFSVPLHDWLTGALRGWAEDLLSPARLRSQGVVDPILTQRIWRRYLGGDASLDHQVWTSLMFQSWMARRGR